MKKDINTRIKNWRISKGTLGIATVPGITSQDAFRYFCQNNWPYIGWLNEPINVEFYEDTNISSAIVTTRTENFKFEITSLNA